MCELERIGVIEPPTFYSVLRTGNNERQGMWFDFTNAVRRYLILVVEPIDISRLAMLTSCGGTSSAEPANLLIRILHSRHVTRMKRIATDDNAGLGRDLVSESSVA